MRGINKRPLKPSPANTNPPIITGMGTCSGGVINSLAFYFLMPSLGEVRNYAELFVRMCLVKNEDGDYEPACAECVEYLDGLLSGGRDGFWFHSVHVPRA